MSDSSYECCRIRIEDKFGSYGLVGAVILNINKCSKELGKSVPQYMIPSKLIQVDKIPLNANGKADSKIALALEKHIPQEVMSDDPITDALLAIFRKVTLNEGVCSTDQFFEAGGTSLGIFQVLAEIESVFGVTLQYADIYNCQKSCSDDSSGKASVYFVFESD